MNQNIALVGEGITDFRVLENIVIGYFRGQLEPVVNYEFPNPLEPEVVGWQSLLSYLRAKKFKQAFQFNHYLIVQIDTDICDQDGFGVSKQNENGQFSVPDLVARVQRKLIETIGAEEWSLYEARFIFAISVHDIECWILPLWIDQDAKAAKVTGCLDTLNRAVTTKAKNFKWVQRGHKDPEWHDAVSKDYRTKKILLDKGPKNPSLKIFLDELHQRNITLSEE